MHVVEGVAWVGKATSAMSASYRAAVYESMPLVLSQVAVIAYLAGEDNAATSVHITALCANS